MMARSLHHTVAPFASVLLVLAAVVAAGRKAAISIPVALVSRSAYPSGTLCVQERFVIVRIANDRRLFINAEPITRRELTGRLEQIFSTRAEPVVYVLGAPELSYGEVVEVIARVQMTVRNVGLLTLATVPTIDEPLLHASFPVQSSGK